MPRKQEAQDGSRCLGRQGYRETHPYSEQKSGRQIDYAEGEQHNYKDREDQVKEHDVERISVGVEHPLYGG